MMTLEKQTRRGKSGPTKKFIARVEAGFTPEAMEWLEGRAAERGYSLSEVIRDCVDAARGR